MSATILPFPMRPDATDRLALLAGHLQTAIPLPCPDDQLTRLIHRADALLSHMDEAALDGWLEDLDAWESRARSTST